MIVSITSSLPEMTSMLERATARIAAVIEEEMVPLTAEVAGIATSEVRGATPRRSGKLANSTIPVSRVGTMSAEIAITQPAVSEANPYSGRGGGFPYAQAVIHGRRMVVPVTARVLWGPGFGPAMRSRATSGNDYPSRAMTAAEPIILNLTAEAAQTMAVRIAAAL